MDFKLMVCIFNGRICVVNFNVFGSQVWFSETDKRLTCELGPISQFEIIGEL
jgi:hypothetical protein